LYNPVMRPPETFETARLMARKPRAIDAEDVFRAYASNPEITRFLSWNAYTTLEPLTRFLADRAADWEQGGPTFTWLLCIRGDPTPIGSIGVSLDPHGAMLGYVLAKNYWRQGLMVEAVHFLVNWAITRPEIFRVWAFCHAENHASARVMQKAGMIREGLLQRWQPFPAFGPEPRDCLIYSTTR
jgi:[ribosomal protein S5]-alanine N-acetyltransferase